MSVSSTCKLIDPKTGNPGPLFYQKYTSLLSLNIPTDLCNINNYDSQNTDNNYKLFLQALIQRLIWVYLISSQSGCYSIFKQYNNFYPPGIDAGSGAIITNYIPNLLDVSNIPSLLHLLPINYGFDCQSPSLCIEKNNVGIRYTINNGEAAVISFRGLDKCEELLKVASGTSQTNLEFYFNGTKQGVNPLSYNLVSRNMQSLYNADYQSVNISGCNKITKGIVPKQVSDFLFSLNKDKLKYIIIDGQSLGSVFATYLFMQIYFYPQFFGINLSIVKLFGMNIGTLRFMSPQLVTNWSNLLTNNNNVLLLNIINTNDILTQYLLSANIFSFEKKYEYTYITPQIVGNYSNSPIIENHEILSYYNLINTNYGLVR